ncbi:MAG: hypothetical protein M1840_002937 [Geoglossum simile]|nr:MAG: hypothetical protein M1840_002937 [Geoglossum simile]
MTNSANTAKRTPNNELPVNIQATQTPPEMSRREYSADPPPGAKRKRTRGTGDPEAGPSQASTCDHVPELFSLERSISPPIRRSSKAPIYEYPETADAPQPKAPVGVQGDKTRLIPSPFHLTRIRDLPSSSNVDTVRLQDILGDPMIKECWQFNYMFDIDFLMGHLDQDVRDLIQVKIIHGSWRKEDQHRINLMEEKLIGLTPQDAAKRYPNIELITAYMPEPFGTHHSKMMVLIRHDNFAQVIIHTANMISFDWTNMTQAVWRSPLLPLSKHSSNGSKQPQSPNVHNIGSGARFKHDLMTYLHAYGQGKTGKLVKELEKYDFSDVRAALVASTPSKQRLGGSREPNVLWGWPGLKRALGSITCGCTPIGDRPRVVVQVSSIASLGQSNKWLTETFFDALSAASSPGHSESPVLPRAPPQKPKFSIIFPTADEIRRSLDGYHSGSSVHMKVQSVAQAKQVAYMKPYFCHWASDVSAPSPKAAQPPPESRRAGRNRATPHIKTYIRFTDSSMNRIDWAMVTSANLSTQAWGAAPNASREVRICSWEIGVLVWPELWKERGGLSGHSEGIDMAPAFMQDLPSIKSSDGGGSEMRTIVGLRMPYGLPPVQYAEDSMPWCATSSYAEPDWRGMTYNTGGV